MPTLTSKQMHCMLCDATQVWMQSSLHTVLCKCNPNQGEEIQTQLWGKHGLKKKLWSMTWKLKRTGGSEWKLYVQCQHLLSPFWLSVNNAKHFTSLEYRAAGLAVFNNSRLELLRVPKMKKISPQLILQHAIILLFGEIQYLDLWQQTKFKAPSWCTNKKLLVFRTWRTETAKGSCECY